jgi:hypothetical protein
MCRSILAPSCFVLPSSARAAPPSLPLVSSSLLLSSSSLPSALAPLPSVLLQVSWILDANDFTPSALCCVLKFHLGHAPQAWFLAAPPRATSISFNVCSLHLVSLDFLFYLSFPHSTLCILCPLCPHPDCVLSLAPFLGPLTFHFAGGHTTSYDA